eukprot:Hpha_TRINITY_DN19707_c0_g1::TRINITY_DN19707_c0_g1_i1::g.21827::m.21827
MEALAKLHEGITATAVLCPNETRWSTWVQCWERTIDLKEDLRQLQLPFRLSFVDIERAILLCKPLATATTVLESEDANLVTVKEQMERVTAELARLKGMEGIMRAAEDLEKFWKMRVEKNFSFDALKVFAILDPAVSQMHWAKEQRKESKDILVRYAKKYWERRRWEWKDAEFEVAVGSFFNQPRSTTNYTKYWCENQMEEPLLSKFAIMIGNIVASEASVERAFRQQKSIFSKTRNHLSHINLCAAMTVVLNYCQLFGDEDIKKQRNAQMRRKETASKRKRMKDERRMTKILEGVKRRRLDF